MKNERKRSMPGGIFLLCIICIICSVFTFAGCTKNNVTDVDDVPDPQLAALKQSAIEQIDDNKLIKIKEKYQLFVSDVVYRYDLERNMLYFSMYADTLAESAKEKVRAATEEQEIDRAVKGFNTQINFWRNDYGSSVQAGGFGIGARTWAIEVNDGTSRFTLREGTSPLSKYPYCLKTQSDEGDISFELAGKNVLFGDDNTKIYEAEIGKDILFRTERYSSEWYVGLIHKKAGKIVGYSMFDRTTQLSVHSVNFVGADKKDITREQVISFMDAYVNGEDGEGKAGVEVTFNKAEITFFVNAGEQNENTDKDKDEIGLRYFGDYGTANVQKAAVEFTSDYDDVTAEIIAENPVIAANEKTLSAKLKAGEKITACDESSGYIDMFFYKGEEFLGYAVFRIVKGENGRHPMLGLEEGVAFTYSNGTRTRITREFADRYLKIRRA